MNEPHQRRFSWPKKVMVHPNMINLALRYRADDFDRKANGMDGHNIRDVGVRMVMMSSLLPKLTARELYLLCVEKASVAIVDEEDNDDYFLTLEFDTDDI